jgi:hypothetical protein
MIKHAYINTIFIHDQTIDQAQDATVPNTSSAATQFDVLDIEIVTS